jgi:hypothetical protein
MFELIPVYFTRSDFHFDKSKLLDKSSKIPDSSVFKSSRLSTNQSGLFTTCKQSKTQSTKKSSKHAKPEKKSKTKNIFLSSRNTSTRRVYDLFLQIEKKKMTERIPDPDKRSMLRTSLKVYSPFKTTYAKKLTPDPDQSLPEQKIDSPKDSYETWKISQNFSTSQKIFIISGTYPDVRKALIQRGWVENPDSESPYFDLKWTRNARIPNNLQDWQMINHFPRNYELSVKWQLYLNIKQGSKNPKTNFLNFMPRCFRLDSRNIEEFFDCFKVTFAVSLLKNYLKNPSQVLIEHVIVSAVICKKWIEKLENFELLESTLVSNIDWKVLTCNEPSELKSLFQRSLFSYHVDTVSTSRAVLKRLQELDPQFGLNGLKNIWILKAGRKSRGRDISLFNDLDQLKSSTSSPNSWVVQKYIENPLLIQERKFDIRQWVLVSSNDPLTIWMYKKSYLRFSLETYSSSDLQNRFIHLTNNSISKKSKHFKASSIEGCMWTLDQFRAFLMSEFGQDIWSQKIYPKMKKIVKYSLENVGNLGRKNSFEVFGYDFMIDEELNPWLLEINSSPAMDYSTVINT